MEFACLASSEETGPNLIKSVLPPPQSQHLSCLLPATGQAGCRAGSRILPRGRRVAFLVCSVGCVGSHGLKSCLEGCKFLWCLGKQIFFGCLSSEGDNVEEEKKIRRKADW